MATATIELLKAVRPNLILDRCYFSMWAYGDTTDYLPQLIAQFDRVSRVTEVRLVILTTTSEGLARRYERQPDLYFSLEKIQAANARFPSLTPLLPASLPYIHIDTTRIGPDEANARVDSFIAARRDAG